MPCIRACSRDIIVFESSSVDQKLIEQVREMASHGTSHHQPEKHLMSKLLELFSTSQDMIYGDNHLDRASETLDGMADHETPSCPSRHPSASRLFDSFRHPYSRHF